MSSIASSSSSSHRNARRARSAFKPSGVSIPDMRFEQSYLASIRSLIHEVSTTEAADDLKRQSGFENEKVDGDVADVLNAGLSSPDDKGQEKPPKVLATRSPAGEPEIWLGRLRIEW